MQLKNVQVEARKNVTPKLNVGLTAVQFNRSAYQDSLQGSLDPSMTYPDVGAKLGLDYSLGGNRSLELDLFYKMTEDLNPRPYGSEELLKIFSSKIGITGSISQAGYGRSTERSRERAMKKVQGGRP
jgi:hypothetical protein